MLKETWGRIQKTITRWNHSQPEETSGTGVGQAPVDPAKLRAIYGRFCYLNVGLNRKERRSYEARLRKLHAGFYRKRTDKALNAEDAKAVEQMTLALRENVKNTPIQVFREVIQLGTHWKQVKYAFVNNPFYIQRSRQGAE